MVTNNLAGVERREGESRGKGKDQEEHLSVPLYHLRPRCHSIVRIVFSQASDNRELTSGHYISDIMLAGALVG